MLSLLGAWVQSQVRELRSCKLYRVACGVGWGGVGRGRAGDEVLTRAYQA